MSVRACLRSLVGRWIWLLKKVKFVSRTLFSSKLHNTSRYNFLSKITRSDSEWLAVSGEIEYMSVRACLRSLVGRWIWLLKKVKFVSRTRLSNWLQSTSRYNFLSKITRSDKWVESGEWWMVSGNLCHAEFISASSLTSNYFSIQFSIENHSKWQPRTFRLVDYRIVKTE